MAGRMSTERGNDGRAMFQWMSLLLIAALAVWTFVTEAGDIRREMHAQALALQQIADAAQRPAVVPESAECHETLALFDEWLAHDLKSGGSGRRR